MKKLKDERIINQTNKILSPMYFLTLVLLISGICIKWQFTKEITMYIIEILVIPITLGYMLISLGVKGLLFQKARDEHTLRMKQSVISKCYGISFFILIIGEFILMLIFPKNIDILSIYMGVWFIPAMIITVYVIKKGLLIWGGKERAKTGIKEFKKRTCIGALFFGIIMGGPHMIKDNMFNPWGFLWIVGMAVSWGVLFYFMMKLMISIREKKADQEVRKAECLDGEEYEEYKDENS